MFSRYLPRLAVAVACLAGLLVGQPALAESSPLELAGRAEQPDSSQVSPQRDAPAPGLTGSGAADGATVQVSPSDSPTYEYSDVGTNHFAALDIAALAADGILAGTDCGPGRFCPDTAIPRWQIAVWLVRVLDGEEPAPRASRFTDIDGGPWWESHVERLAELDVTKGCSLEPARFCPTDTVDRAQMAAFLDRAFNLPDAPEPAGFTDTEGVFSRDSIDSLFHSGITYGCSDVPLQFCPNKDVSRAQMAAFLQRSRPAPDGIVSIGHDVRPDDRFYVSPLAGISNVVVSVHYCGPPDAFTEAMLVAETQKLNQVATFFERQSGGEATLTLAVGGLHSPDEAMDPTEWAEESITKWADLDRGDDPCYKTVLGDSDQRSSSPDRRNVALILADVDIGSNFGRSVAGFGPPGGRLFDNVEPYVVVQPSTRYSSSYRYRLVAHEIGHAAYSLCHTFSRYPGCAVQGADDDVKTECRRGFGAPNCGGDERLAELAGSVMSYAQYGSYWKLSDSYVACEQKNWLGWHDKSCGAPSAPRVHSVEPGDRQFTVRWTPPRDDGWSPITGYELSYRTRGGDDWRSSQSLAASVTAAGFFNLRNGEEYEFRVRGRNSEGAGDWSPIGTVTPTLLRPDAPARPRLTPGDEQVVVEWDAPDDNGSPIIGYIVEYRRVGDGDWKSRTFTRSPTQRTITGLENDAQYQFRVRALNSLGFEGAGDWSPTATATPTAEAQVPDAPGNLRLTPGDEQITVEWDAPDDNGSPITRYTVFYRPKGVGNFAGPSTSSTQRTIAGLENGTEYEFYVRAVNSEGRSERSPIATATPTADAQVPDAPARPRLTPGDEQITVAWTAPDDNGEPITGYIVEYRRVGDASWKSRTFTRSPTQRTITGLENDTAYQFRVRARNSEGSEGLGDWSPIATATPTAETQAPDAPGRPRLTAGYEQITVEWDAPDDNGSPITGYTVELYRSGVRESGHGYEGAFESDVFTDLDNGIVYGFRVQAHNSEGGGDWSPIATARPTATAPRPNAPYGPWLTPGDGQITVQWDAPDDNGTPVTGYEVDRYRDGHPEEGRGTGPTDRSWISIGLENGVEYEFRVRAIGSQGRSDWSTATATPGVPDAPGNLRLTPGDGEILVEWDAPDDNGSPITRYGVAYWTVGDTDHIEEYVSASARSWTISGLENGVEYQVGVFAENAAGRSGGPTDAAVPTADAQVPDAPDEPRLTPGDGQITVEWDEPDDNGASITSYLVDYKRSGGVWRTYSEVTTLTTSIGGLDNGVEYEVRVRAGNSEGFSDGSPTAPATPGVPVAPAVPRLRPSDEQIVIDWVEPDDNGSAITRYPIRYRKAGAGRWRLAQTFSSTQLTLSSLDNNVTYEIYIEAENSRGVSDPSPTATATPYAGGPGPDAPAAPRATPGNGQVTLEWDAPDDNGNTITRYLVKWQKAGDTSFTTSWSSSTRRTVTSLENGVAYEFRVRAKDSEGFFGGWSPPATATPSQS